MGAIAVHHTATEDSAWDGPAAVAAMPAEKATLHYCHAWQETDAGDEKSGYKFPHHRKQGGPANIPACRNGLARLDSADIPDGDRAGVRAHLQAHLDDADDSKDDHMRTGIGIANLAAYGTMSDAQRVKAGLPRVRQFSDKPFTLKVRDAADGEPAAVDIFGEIGWSWWGDGVEANEFAQQLAAITADTITVRVNSPGGDVFDGIAITNLLRAHPATVNVVVMGLAASAASVISMAGDSISMMPNSEMMIHDASGFCIGNAADMAEMVTLLDHVSNNIASAYAARAGGTTADWRDVMRGEQWYTADEAVAAGLADRVGNAPTAAASTATDRAWNLSFFAYQGRDSAPAPTVRPAAAVAPAQAHTASDEAWAAAIRKL